MEEAIICPGCGHEFKVEMWTTGSCPNCEKYDYYFDSTYNPETGEEDYLGAYWDLD